MSGRAARTRKDCTRNMPASPVSHIKSAILATLIAALVWIFAEGESLASRTVVVPVVFPAEASSDVVIRLEDPSFTGTVRVRLEGTARTIDLAATAVGGRIRLTPGLPGVPNEPGERRVVDLREAISNTPELKDLGSTVAEVEPRVVVVQVLKMVSRELPVRVEFGAEIALDGDPVVAPPSVTLRLPEYAAAKVPEGAVATATVPEAEIRRFRADGAQTVSVPIKPPPALGAVDPLLISPESCTVTVRLRRKLETYKVPSIPVWFSLPPTEDGSKWSVQIVDKFLTDVMLTGPADDVQRVRAGQATIKGLVELSTEDLERAVSSKPVTFTGLPAGVSVGGSPTVRLKIGRRGPLPDSPASP